MSPKRLLLIAACMVVGVSLPSLAGPHAVEIIRAQGPFGPAPYDDAAAVLGAPATRFYDPFGPLSGAPTNGRVKLVEPAYNIAAETNGLPTPNLLLTLGAGSEVIARLDEPATNHPANPYGIDLLVFGNTFYGANGAVNDNANMNTLALTGGAFSERLKVSVSPGYTGQPGELPDDPETWPWHRYEGGPYGDSVFPTQAFEWDRDTESWTDTLMDFTKPVNPAMQTIIAAGGLMAADAIDFYAGAGGGTGFDLSESGFEAIRYLKVDGLDAGYSNGEMDAVSAVRPSRVGDSLTVAPQNIDSNTASLFFQWPAAPTATQLRLDFVTLDAIALVTTTAITNLAAFPALPGTPLNAVETALTRLGGSGNVNYQANVVLSAGPTYTGDGSDLLALQLNGVSWIERPFAFDAASSHLTLSGITHLSAFVVAQLAAPTLKLHATPDNVSVEFVPVPGYIHATERSTNFVTWTTLHTFTATNSAPVIIPDNAPPPGQAFYRLRLTPP